MMISKYRDEILELLTEHTQMTAPELAQHIGVSEKTIRRAIEKDDFLVRYVMPIQGRGGGYQLSPDAARRDLTSREFDILLTLQGMVELLSELPLRLLNSAFRGVKSHALDTRLSNYVYLDPEKWFQPDDIPDYIETLHKIYRAIADHKRISFRYRKATTFEEKTVEPYGLVGKAGFWYLVAKRDKDFRTYKVERIHHIETLNPFTRSPEFELSTHWTNSSEAFEEKHYEVSFRVEASCLPVLQRIFGEKIYSQPPDEDGWYSFDEDLRDADYAHRIMLGFGARAYIIAPVELRENVIQDAYAFISRCHDKTT